MGRIIPVMVLFSHSTKELTAKVVYYGPGLCGKTTNLQWIHEKLPIKNKGKILSLATETDGIFDFLPIELGTIRGMKTRIQLYTVPGRLFYNTTRRMVLKGADCGVFIADSQDAMLEANAGSLENLKENLEVNGISLDDIPLVMQYNKRDLPNALPVDQLNARLNPRGVPYYEAVACKGIGVEETLKGATSLVFKSLATRYDDPEGKAAASKTSVPTPKVVKPSSATAARATGALSPSDLLEAEPVEAGSEERETPPLEIVEEFSPLAELEGFDPPSSGGETLDSSSLREPEPTGWDPSELSSPHPEPPPAPASEDQEFQLDDLSDTPSEHAPEAPPLPDPDVADPTFKL